MKLSDNLIRVRELLLDRLAGVRPGLVLNPQRARGSARPRADLASRLSHCLQELRATAAYESGTTIDYTQLRSSPAYLEYRESCLSQLLAFKPQSLPTVNAQRAFWINLYNALVIDAVIAFDVENSVTEGVLGAITFFHRAAYHVDGKRVSLDDIEHGILRGNRGHPFLPGRHFSSDDPRQEWILPLDPRIHFALNCGARSCPPIRVYTAPELDAQLELATRSFVNHAVTIQAGEVRLSKLFRWYRADFGGREGMRQLLLNYLEGDEERELMNGQVESLHWRYTPYDWGLNRVSSASL